LGTLRGYAEASACVWVPVPMATSLGARQSEGESSDATLNIEIGTEISYRGRRFRVVGISPMSAAQRSVILEDPQTKERLETDITAAAEFRRLGAPDLPTIERE
jgi:hypothetical protein